MARTAKKKIQILDEGILLVDDVDSLNFAGSGVVGTNTGNAVTETVSGGGGGGTPGGSTTQLQYNNAGAFGGITNILTDGTNLGFGTAAPTNSATFGSTSTGIALYNTVDQTTNFERLRISYQTNVAEIRSDAGGTGTARLLRLMQGGASTVAVDVNSNSSATSGFLSVNRSTSVTNVNHFATTGTTTAPSGVNYFVTAFNTVNQSGSAGYTAFFANITETTTGSGAKNLMDLQVGSSSKFKVDNAGHVTVEGVTSTGATGTGKIVFDTAPQLSRIGINQASTTGIGVDVNVDGTTLTQGLRVQGHATTDSSFGTYVTGDANLRFAFRADGRIVWGDGTAGADVNLYRTATATVGTDQTFTIGTSLGVGTLAPTHAITLANGFQQAFYNTTDQTTNYERARLNWASNVFTLQTENAGTGVSRGITLNAVGTNFNINSDAGFSSAVVARRDSTSSTFLLAVASSQLTGSTVAQNAFTVATKVVQTSTASYRGLWVTPWISSKGSGGALLMDLGTNTAINATGTHTSKFSVNDSGNTLVAGTLGVTGHVTVEGVTSTGATGTGKLVFDTLPTLTTPIVNNIFFAPSGTASEQFYFYGKGGATIPVPFFYPNTANTSLAFDISPNGTPGNTFGIGPTWIDLLSTDVNNANYEVLRISKRDAGACYITSAKGGTGSYRDFMLQYDFSVSAISGNTGIGTPTASTLLQVGDNTVGGVLNFQQNGGSSGELQLFYLTETVPRLAFGRDMLGSGNDGFILKPSSTGTIANTGSGFGSSTAGVLDLYTSNGTALTKRVTINGSGLVTVNGSLTLSTAGNKLSIATGTNASVGTATLVGGTVTVSTTAVTASSKIFLTDATTGTLTNIGTPTVGTIVAGTSFVINSSNVLDTSNINWFIIN